MALVDQEGKLRHYCDSKSFFLYSDIPLSSTAVPCEVDEVQIEFDPNYACSGMSNGRSKLTDQDECSATTCKIDCGNEKEPEQNPSSNELLANKNNNHMSPIETMSSVDLDRQHQLDKIKPSSETNDTNGRKENNNHCSRYFNCILF